MSAYRIHGISMTICRSLPGRCLVVMVCAGIAADPLAAAVAVQAPSADEFANAKGGEGPFTFVDNISRDNYLLGDMWGLRPWICRALTLKVPPCQPKARWVSICSNIWVSPS